jgi:hypothetical protein
MKLKSSMKTSLLLLLAIFASLTNNQAANIPITYLPYTISAPGTYVLNTDLTAIPNSYAILINQPIGNVTLDLKGHTLHMSGDTSYGIVAKMNGSAAGIVTIQNGTISVSAYGLDVKNTVSPEKDTNLMVQNVTFQNNTTSAEDIYLEQTNYVQIKSCKFVGVGRLGIMDENSPTGNTFTNLSFDGKLSVNMTEDGTPPLIVNFSSHR